MRSVGALQRIGVQGDAHQRARRQIGSLQRGRQGESCHLFVIGQGGSGIGICNAAALDDGGIWRL